jgi:hypothetical protein
MSTKMMKERNWRYMNMSQNKELLQLLHIFTNQHATPVTVTGL